MKNMKKKVCWLLLLVGLIGMQLTVFEKEAASQETKYEFKEGTTIVGKIVRPELALFFQRMKVNYEALKSKESFLPRIKRSVRQGSF